MITATKTIPAHSTGPILRQLMPGTGLNRLKLPQMTWVAHANGGAEFRPAKNSTGYTSKKYKMGMFLNLTPCGRL